MRDKAAGWFIQKEGPVDQRPQAERTPVRRLRMGQKVPQNPTDALLILQEVDSQESGNVKRPDMAHRVATVADNANPKNEISLYSVGFCWVNMCLRFREREHVKTLLKDWCTTVPSESGGTAR